jgi:glycosyltransferase involved in cell wall biosynthesis
MIICHFNDWHLPYAVASLKRQSQKTYTILVDDGSASQFKRALPRIDDVETIQMPTNKGIGHARNVGLSQALKNRCDFIGFLDSDGIADPSFIERALECLICNNDLLGVSARKGLANPKARTARIKYRYKIYKKDDFQIDCSLFKKEALQRRMIPNRRSGEDSVFILSFRSGELSKLDIPYYHFEREGIREFFRDEYYGAFYSFKTNHKKTFLQILMTPFTSAKMIFRNHWILEGLLFPFRQLVWLTGYLNGNRLAS